MPEIDDPVKVSELLPLVLKNLERKSELLKSQEETPYEVLESKPLIPADDKEFWRGVKDHCLDYLNKIALGSRYVKWEESRIRGWDQIVEWLKRYKVGERKGFVMSGTRGAGKSTTLHAVAHLLYAKAGKWNLLNSGLIFRVPTMSIKIIRASSLTKALIEKNYETVEGLAEADVLMIDDFARHYQADYPTSLLEDFIESRYGKEKPTFVSMDITLEKLAGNENWEAIVDRFRDKNWMFGALVIPGKSQRGN